MDGLDQLGFHLSAMHVALHDGHQLLPMIASLPPLMMRGILAFIFAHICSFHSVSTTGTLKHQHLSMPKLAPLHYRHTN